jgi:hypothetical protein
MRIAVIQIGWPRSIESWHLYSPVVRRRATIDSHLLSVMSRRRTKRYWTEMDRDALLAAVASCRDACVRAITRAPNKSDVYEATSRLMDAIDDVACVLTGDRTHFHLKPHSAPGEMPKVAPEK